MSAALPAPSDRIAAVRRFNRFYTRRIGVLHEGLGASKFSLTQSRLLWELAHRETSTAAALAQELGLNPGYLSRLLRGFKERGLVKAARTGADARRIELTLSAAGRRAYAHLDAQSSADVQALLGTLAEAQQQQLLAALQRIEELLEPASRSKAPFLLRPHRAGDMGWVMSRHGALYAQEYGWDLRFEAMVGHIASRFIEQFDPQRECCWIAEREGVSVGCVLLVQARNEKSGKAVAHTAQLRLLLVEPAARGLGIGRTLVRECERFARQAGYRKIVLWTDSTLDAAHAIYEKAGFRRVAHEAHHSFGHDLVGETWQLDLQ